ncbi:phosphoadenosine phosphosulfate reductase family protein [Mycobacterium xenopi 3993]|nr:phosphoadenosine phosphosulfate reductase family protein [Mycobacterium xenopi 3993]
MPNSLQAAPQSVRSDARRVDELRLLEAEAVHIIREVVAELERPVLLFSAGKDSIVLLRLAEKAFRPLPLPFPVMHVDTGHNFPEVIEFRDRRVTGHGHKLIVASVQESIDSGRVPDPAPGVAQPGADPHPARRAGSRRLRRRVRRCPPRRGTCPRQGTDFEFPRRIRPVGSPCPAARAVVAVQRPDQEGRTGAGVPAEQLDRARRVALHPAGKP